MPFPSVYFVLLMCVFAQGRDRRVVDIKLQGLLNGELVEVDDGQYVVKYLGIPFAQPPVGDLRFKPPETERLPAWSHIMDASKPKPSCLQDLELLKKHERIFQEMWSEKMIEYLEFDEDCLYLNIYMPLGVPPKGKWPVVVWFHSGDFKVGSPNLWDGSALAAKQKVIVVIPAYRLNVLGFLALDDVPGSGNYGMLDQVAALDWVKKKISSFGGSETDICVMGHGAGGTGVGLHMLSPLSTGKFLRAIAMSGSAFSRDVRAMPNRKVYNNLAKKFCCSRGSGQDLIDCFRKVEVKSLVEKASAFYDWGPVIDYSNNSFLPAPPLHLLETGKFNKLDFMAGYTNKEEILDISKFKLIENGITTVEFEDLIERELREEFANEESKTICPYNIDLVKKSALFYYSPHPETADTTLLRNRYSDYVTERRYGSGIYKQSLYTSMYSNTFVYRFDYKPKMTLFTSIPEWAYVPHGFELPFVWGMPYWSILRNVHFSAADRRMVDTIMSLWGNFAKYGNPIQNGLQCNWELFKKVKPGVMIIDSNFNMSNPSIFDCRAFDFWNEYFPSIIESTRCCNKKKTTKRTGIIESTRCSNTKEATKQAGFQIQTNLYLTGLTAILVGWPLR